MIIQLIISVDYNEQLLQCMVTLYRFCILIGFMLCSLIASSAVIQPLSCGWDRLEWISERKITKNVNNTRPIPFPIIVQ